VQTVVGWHVEIEFDEDDTQANAALLLRLPDGVKLRGRGHAKRNPADQLQPRIGEGDRGGPCPLRPHPPAPGQGSG